VGRAGDDAAHRHGVRTGAAGSAQADPLCDNGIAPRGVDAFLAAALSEQAPGREFDIASGTQLSIRDTIELLAKIVGAHQLPHYGAVADRPLDRPQVADIGPAGELLGWHPRTSLETGLRRTADWYSSTL
jgi:UDP-glucose 4-epimerase